MGALPPGWIQCALRIRATPRYSTSCKLTALDLPFLKPTKDSEAGYEAIVLDYQHGIGELLPMITAVKAAPQKPLAVVRGESLPHET